MRALHPVPAPARGPRFSRVPLRTGVALHVAEQGEADGVPVVLLHGYSDSWFSWSRVMPWLDGGLRVIAPDQRGHGASGRHRCYGMDDLGEDVLALLDARGIERAVLVGHSMGSFVAQRVAEAAPGRVAGLALVGSGTTPAGFTGMADLAAAVAALGDPVPRAFVHEFQYSCVHAPVPEAFMTTAIAQSLRLDAATWRGLMQGLLACPAPATLAAAGIPTWLAWGDRDALASGAERARLASLVGAHTRTEYAETGHTPQWERPESFAFDLQQFVSRAAAAPRSRRSA